MPRVMRLTIPQAMPVRPKENAQAAYAALARSEVMSSDPIYLKAEVRSSPMPWLEHDESIFKKSLIRRDLLSCLQMRRSWRLGLFPNPM